MNAQIRIKLGIAFCSAVLVCLAVVTAVAEPEKSETAAPTVDWERVVKLRPELKVLVLLESKAPISLMDLATLADMGLVPADRDPGLTVGLKSAVFKCKLENWMYGPPLPRHIQGWLLERFIMSGIYRTGFRVEEKGYEGPLTLEVTAPRSGFGRELLKSSSTVRPETKTEMKEDSVGNRWLVVHYPKVKYHDVIKFHFSFKYLVDMAELLKHDILMAAKTNTSEIPQTVERFLEPGYKIDSSLPQARAWAAQGEVGPPDARKEFQRLSKYLKERVTYDMRKRKEYFGGRAVYSDLDEMYQPMSVTLSTRLGACPDTCLLECAFYRARGIPCRTAGRFGHFFSLIYAPGRGWMSTSVTPTGIPLFIAPGPDHMPYQKWRPRMPLKTVRWEARVRIEPLEE